MHPFAKTSIVAVALLLAGNSFAGEVSRAIFTIGVDNREPVIKVDSIDSGAYNSISFFTELNELEGHNVTHQWTYNGEVMFEKTFEVKGARWRVWTSNPHRPGPRIRLQTQQRNFVNIISG